MDDGFLSKTEKQEWIEKRIKEVNKVYNTYSALIEYGIDIPDQDTSYQVLCPFHDDKNKPSARYYAASGNESAHFYCFKCKLRLDSVGIYARLNQKRFTDALSELERRFRIHVPKRPDNPIIIPNDRGSDYQSEAWGDVQRVIDLLEIKLIRNRSRSSMNDFINAAVAIDKARWEFRTKGVSSDSIRENLAHAHKIIDNFDFELV